MTSLRLPHAWLVLTSLVCTCTVALAAAPDPALRELIRSLPNGDYDDRAAVVEQILATGDARAETVVTALAENALFRRRDDGEVVRGERDGRSYLLFDVLTGESLGVGGRRDVRRIPANTALRSRIEQLLARQRLIAGDTAARLAAAEALLDAPGSVSSGLLEEALRSEPDAGVRELLQLAVLLDALRSDRTESAADAARALASWPLPAVRGALAEVIADADRPESLRSAATASLSLIERRLAQYEWIQTVFFGLSLGSVLVLAAMGLAITFGVMGVINMAHGELVMIGAYVTYVLQLWLPGAIGWTVPLAVPVAFIVSGLVGMVIERGVIRHLYGRPLETLLATFGVSLILQQAARSLFSPLNRNVVTPDWMSGSLELASGLAFTLNRMWILGFTLAVFAVLLLVLRHTRLGLQIRAVAQNRDMARGLGVRTDRIDSLTFGLGAGLAGVAGVALSLLTNVGPNLGQSYIVDAFLVVVFGGVGNLWGTLAAGLSLGVTTKLMEPWAGAVLAKILVLVGIILFIQRYPRGLVPQPGRAVETG